jgi:hypothetical protein
MRTEFLLYGILLGLLPLLITEVAVAIDPESPWAYSAWYVFLTLPLGLFAGILLAFSA